MTTITQTLIIIDENDRFQNITMINQNQFKIHTIYNKANHYFVKSNFVDLLNYNLNSNSFTNDYLLFYGYENIAELKDRHPIDWRWRTALMIAKTEIFFGSIVAYGTLEFCENFILNKMKN